jgi:N-methylhydantoinase A
VQKGYDLREFILVPFGGAAPNHAVEIASALGIGKIVVPPMCGNFSALGLVVADVQHDYVRTIAKKQQEIGPTDLIKNLSDLEQKGVRQLKEESIRDDDIHLEWSADLRYEGQSWELNTPIERTPVLSERELENILSSFHSLHHQVYCYSEPGEHVEFINLRVTAIGRNPSLTLPEEREAPTSLSKALKETRSVYFKDRGFMKIPIYERDDLGCGTQISGPCIVEEKISTTMIPSGWVGLIDRYKNIIIAFE